MTKKDFIALADTVRANMPSERNAPELFAHWAVMRDALANMCQRQSPGFNRARWLDYVNGKSGPNPHRNQRGPAQTRPALPSA